ncbi:TetR/AcrR family transcriptional regulator [Glaciibacter superstes]|uniref:TetR/AcrR family transcriptional regulator n=1 Tax=Glaciibacter superstes TaxID=501023 RepID=UPI0003B41AA4|nr:TetR/AcrR family transcriptional regulator [Glaciibacter superstes]
MAGSIQLRADARDNRDRIVEVAGAVFGEMGTTISMTDIARRAEVGVATLFRRFPTKESLVDAVFTATVERWLGRLAESLAKSDAWVEMKQMIEEIAAEQARHPACADMMVTSFLHGDGFVRERQIVADGFEELIRRSKINADVVSDLEWLDIALLMEANAGVVMAADHDAKGASSRLTRRLLDAFQPSRT